MHEWENFSNIIFYLRNHTRQAHIVYGMLLASHRCQVSLHLFQWPWVTLKGGRKGSNFSGGFT